MPEFTPGQRISPRDVADHLSAWIDPDGKVYHVDECKHWNVATEKFHSDVDTLEKSGWAHLSYGQIHRLPKPTQAQVDAFYDIKEFVVEGRDLAHHQFQIGLREYARQFQIAFEDVLKDFAKNV